MAKIRGFDLYFTKFGRDRLDNLGIDEYKIKDVIKSYWNSKKIENRRQNKYFIILWHKERYVKIRFRIYDEEKRILVIMAETFKKLKK